MKSASAGLEGGGSKRVAAMAWRAAVIVAVCCLALYALNRPRWHTQTIPGDFAGTTVAVECPDNWVSDDPIDYPDFVPIRHLELHPRPLSGMALWWHKHLPGYRPGPPTHSMNEVSVAINVLPASWHKSHPQWILDALTQSYQAPSDIAGLYDSARRTQHTLGPALAIMEDRAEFFPDKPDSVPFKPQHTESILIYPAYRSDEEIGHIEIVCTAPADEYPRLKPVFDEIMQRVHLARK